MIECDSILERASDHNAHGLPLALATRVRRGSLTSQTRVGGA